MSTDSIQRPAAARQGSGDAHSRLSAAGEPKPDRFQSEGPRADGPTPDLARLREYAGERLARYKLPDDMVVLSALPLTAGEKVDRRALERLIATN